VSSAAGRDRLPVAAALAALTVAAGLYLLSGINTRDEAWFLQVVTRVADGDALYRDVFFGATPLSIWLTWPLVALFGAQLAWVKLLVLAAFAATLAFTAWSARRLGAGTAAVLVLAVAMLVLATPLRSSLYQPLATTFLAACLALALVWTEGGPRAGLAVAAAGAAAGLAFAAKQNVGLYALAALLLAVLVGGEGRRVRAWSLAAAGFAVCALLPLLPVAATGGLGAFWDYALAGKGSYADLGSVSYLRGFRLEAVQARDLLTGGSLLDAILPAYHALLYLAVPAILVSLVLAWLRSAGEERRRVEVVGLFALASAAAIFPRADASHVVVVSPVLLLAGWYAGHLLLRGWEPGRRRAGLVAAGIAVVLAPGALVAAAWPAVQADRGARPSDLPFARGVLIAPEREARMRETAFVLSRAGADGPLFLATPEAGFYYLLSGVSNPTPYDYPLASAFGRTGQAELVARIRQGDLDAVCLGIRRADNLTPWRLVYTVKTTMEPGERTPPCRVYRQPAGQ
jgi:4-amino-4-deoxy-L-arabinose transferase-like glycosyltransferase